MGASSGSERKSTGRTAQSSYLSQPSSFSYPSEAATARKDFSSRAAVRELSAGTCAASGAVRKRAGVDHIRFHDLRHTAASEMLRRGLRLREVQYVLGHSSARMTERYAHFAPSFRPPKAIDWCSNGP